MRFRFLNVFTVSCNNLLCVGSSNLVPSFLEKPFCLLFTKIMFGFSKPWILDACLDSPSLALLLKSVWESLECSQQKFI